MKRFFIKTIVGALLISGIAPVFSKVHAEEHADSFENGILINLENNINSGREGQKNIDDVQNDSSNLEGLIDTEINYISKETADDTNNGIVEYQVDVEKELGVDKDSLQMIVSEYSDKEMSISSQLESEGLDITSDMYINTDTGEITLSGVTTLENGKVDSQNFNLFFHEIQGENFIATAVDQSTGEIYEINTIDAQASVLPALVIGVVLKEGAKWAIKKYGPKLLISTFSRAAISAAIKNIGKFAVSNKHLSNAGGNYRKFNTTSKTKINQWIKEGLQSKNISISLNDNDKLSFVITVNLGKKIGTKGEKKIKIVIGYDGKIWTSYPIA
ncbi:SAR2788 family putative toxin [Peribacillus frigoritolerans]